MAGAGGLVAGWFVKDPRRPLGDKLVYNVIKQSVIQGTPLVPIYHGNQGTQV